MVRAHAPRAGGRVVAEMNPQVPFIETNTIAYKDLAAVVEFDAMLPDMGGWEPTPPEQAIGKHIGKLLPNRRRFTLQVGIGNAVGGPIS